MNYTKIYNELINKRRKIPYTGQIERHHILPKCLGGSNDESNLVDLSLREHFVAHLLLHKMYPMHRGLLGAVLFFSEKKTSRSYEFARSEYLKTRIGHTDQCGKRNSNFGLYWWTNILTGNTVKSSVCPSSDFIRGRSLPKATPCYFKIKLLLDQKLFKELVENHSEEIRFGKHGWKSRLSKHLGISPQKVTKWLNRVSPDFINDLICSD